MNDAVITLNGLEKRFPGMDKARRRTARLHHSRRLCDGAGWAGRCGQNHADADAGGITETRQPAVPR